MARSRNIKPGFFANDKLSECSPLARLLFIGLWGIADRNGVFEDRPRKIKAQVIPYDDGDIDEMLRHLVDSGFILRFEADGSDYFYVVNFDRHQKPHANEKALYPSPPKKSVPDPLGPKPGTSDMNDEGGRLNKDGGKRNEEVLDPELVEPDLKPFLEPDLSEFEYSWSQATELLEADSMFLETRFVDAMASWGKARNEAYGPLTPHEIQAAIRSLDAYKMDLETSIKVVLKADGGGWKQLRPEDFNQGSGGGTRGEISTDDYYGDPIKPKPKEVECA